PSGHSRWQHAALDSPAGRRGGAGSLRAAGQTGLSGMDKTERLGVLMREVRVRVVNISRVGTLLESHKRMAVGTLGRLRLRLGDGEYIDDVEVARCDAVEDTGLFQIGMRFLFTTSRHQQSIRGALARFSTPLSAAMETPSRTV